MGTRWLFVVAAIALALLAIIAIFIWRGRKPVQPDERIEVMNVPVPRHQSARSPPLIRRVLVGEARVGERVGLECDAPQIDGEPNAYKWVGPFGLTKESASNVAVWTPARAGAVTITCWARNTMGTSHMDSQIVVLPAIDAK